MTQRYPLAGTEAVVVLLVVPATGSFIRLRYDQGPIEKRFDSGRRRFRLRASVASEVDFLRRCGARMAVIGSSLGGFYAMAVAERFGCPAVLLNPAVDPARDLAAYIGEQTQFHTPEEHFFFEPAFVDELRALHAGPLRQPERFFAIIAKGDEVLDWREMVGRYPGAQIRLLEGSDHALSDFDTHIDSVIQFLGLG